MSYIANYLYNRCLPKQIISDDANNDFLLKRFIQAICDGGLGDKLVFETKNLLTLIDPKTMPDEYLTYYADSVGYPWDYELSADFQRRILCNWSYIVKRKGSLPVLKYICKELALSETKIVETCTGFRTFNKNKDSYYSMTYGSLGDTPHYIYGDYAGSTERVTLIITIKVDDKSKLPEKEVMERFLQKFVPPYVHIILIYSYLYVEEAFIVVTEEDSIQINIFDEYIENLDIDYTLWNSILLPRVDYEFEMLSPNGTITNNVLYRLNTSFKTNGHYHLYDKVIFPVEDTTVNVEVSPTEPTNRIVLEVGEYIADIVATISDDSSYVLLPTLSEELGGVLNPLGGTTNSKQWRTNTREFKTNSYYPLKDIIKTLEYDEVSVMIDDELLSRINLGIENDMYYNMKANNVAMTNSSIYRLNKTLDTTGFDSIASEELGDINLSQKYEDVFSLVPNPIGAELNKTNYKTNSTMVTNSETHVDRIVKKG